MVSLALVNRADIHASQVNAVLEMAERPGTHVRLERIPDEPQIY